MGGGQKSLLREGPGEGLDCLLGAKLPISPGVWSAFGVWCRPGRSCGGDVVRRRGDAWVGVRD